MAIVPPVLSPSEPLPPLLSALRADGVDEDEVSDVAEALVLESSVGVNVDVKMTVSVVGSPLSPVLVRMDTTLVDVSTVGGWVVEGVVVGAGTVVVDSGTDMVDVESEVMVVVGTGGGEVVVTGGGTVVEGTEGVVLISVGSEEDGGLVVVPSVGVVTVVFISDPRG
jgi:hypothetical protein